jgi:uncharacterized protein (DUF486 family)
MIPANRLASKSFEPAQLKIIQEAITLIVFGFFSVLYLKESFKLNYLLSFVCILGAVFFAFKKFWLKISVINITSLFNYHILL